MINRSEEEENKPPILQTWNRLYALVIGNLVLLIILFSLLTFYLN